MKVYCIYDRVAEEAAPLFTAKNDKIACRHFRNALEFNKVNEPKDFMLYCLGEFDPDQPALFGDKVPTILNTSEDDDE